VNDSISASGIINKQRSSLSRDCQQAAERLSLRTRSFAFVVYSTHP